jgi:23S rRNA (uracil1939-C5)-methyltransferase
VKTCQHFGICGGCDWQNLSYQEQLARKHARLAGFLQSALGSRSPAAEAVIGMRVDASGAPWGFRHKAAFVFGEAPDRRGSTIGHYAAHSRRVVPIVECPVHADRANRLAFALHDHLARAHVPAAGPTLRGVLRHLIVRTTRDNREAVAMLVVTRNDRSLRTPIRAFLGTEDAADGFYLNIHDRPGPYMVGRETISLRGRSHVRESIAGVSFLVSPTTFFQTNVEAAERLVGLVLEETPEDAVRVLDLYSGSGLFTLPLAKRGHEVTSVEENATAVRDAEANIRLNRLSTSNVRLHLATVEAALPRYRHEVIDHVILDPPRSGCPPVVIDTLFAQMRPSRVLYVSCSPDALVAEMPAILRHGYRISRVQPVDMFPHTTHLETFVVLDRQ